MPHIPYSPRPVPGRPNRENPVAPPAETSAPVDDLAESNEADDLDLFPELSPILATVKSSSPKKTAAIKIRRRVSKTTERPETPHKAGTSRLSLQKYEVSAQAVMRRMGRRR